MCSYLELIWWAPLHSTPFIQSQVNLCKSVGVNKWDISSFIRKAIQNRLQDTCWDKGCVFLFPIIDLLSFTFWVSHTRETVWWLIPCVSFDSTLWLQKPSVSLHVTQVYPSLWQTSTLLYINKDHTLSMYLLMDIQATAKMQLSGIVLL